MGRRLERYPPRYITGDHYLIDDRTGFRIRASDAIKQWDGSITHKDQHEERHPQDFIRGRINRQQAENIAGVHDDTFIDVNDVTQDDL